MPRKIRESTHELERAGFGDRGGKGSDRNLKHANGVRITVSGKPGSDAKPYQERVVARAIEDSKQSSPATGT